VSRKYEKGSFKLPAAILGVAALTAFGVLYAPELVNPSVCTLNTTKIGNTAILASVGYGTSGKDTNLALAYQSGNGQSKNVVVNYSNAGQPQPDGVIFSYSKHRVYDLTATMKNLNDQYLGFLDPTAVCQSKVNI
jgi:hypothetical protein